MGTKGNLDLYGDSKWHLDHKFLGNQPALCLLLTDNIFSWQFACRLVILFILQIRQRFVCRYANRVSAALKINLLSSLIDLEKVLQNFCNVPSVLCMFSG